jgi:hypothetical protein
MKITQKDRILKHLQEYGSITTWDSFSLYGDTRLSDKIYRLKKEGYDFNEEWETKMNRFGNPVTFKRYILK